MLIGNVIIVKTVNNTCIQNLAPRQLMAYPDQCTPVLTRVQIEVKCQKMKIKKKKNWWKFCLYTQFWSSYMSGSLKKIS